jgi:hypothetical protein
MRNLIFKGFITYDENHTPSAPFIRAAPVKMTVPLVLRQNYQIQSPAVI